MLDKLVNRYHDAYVREMKRLWDKYAEEFGCSEKYGVRVKFMFTRATEPPPARGNLALKPATALKDKLFVHGVRLRRLFVKRSSK